MNTYFIRLIDWKNKNEAHQKTMEWIEKDIV
jgi:hypothetical protein